MGKYNRKPEKEKSQRIVHLIKKALKPVAKKRSDRGYDGENFPKDKDD